MTKMTFALAAALIAGTTMTSAANADGVRLGFGFPLGSFVAHSNENYGGNDYRRAERPRYVRRDDQDDAPVRKVTRIKQPLQAEVAEASVKAPITTSAAPTAKLEDRLPSDPATTTVIEKTSAAKTDEAPSNTITTASTETKATVNAEKITPADKPAAATAHVCHRYSPAIAALIEVPCE